MQSRKIIEKKLEEKKLIYQYKRVCKLKLQLLLKYFTTFCFCLMSDFSAVTLARPGLHKIKLWKLLENAKNHDLRLHRGCALGRIDTTSALGS